MDKLHKYITEIDDETNQHKQQLIELYNNFIKSKQQLKEYETTFIKCYSSIAIAQTTLNSTLKHAFKTFKETTQQFNERFPNADENIQQPKTGGLFQGNNVSKPMQQWIDDKLSQQKTVIQLLFDLSNIIYNIYTEQNLYFTILYQILCVIKKQFELIGSTSKLNSILLYFTKPELVIQCINADINTLLQLTKNIKENINSKTYFSNIANFTLFKETELTQKNTELLYTVNYSDLQNRYNTDPSILLMEMRQYNIYFII